MVQYDQPSNGTWVDAQTRFDFYSQCGELAAEQWIRVRGNGDSLNDGVDDDLAAVVIVILIVVGISELW